MIMSFNMNCITRNTDTWLGVLCPCQMHVQHKHTMNTRKTVSDKPCACPIKKGKILYNCLHTSGRSCLKEIQLNNTKNSKIDIAELVAYIYT